MCRLNNCGQIRTLVMIRQKSFEQEKPTVYLVPTPIGNLSEMTSRALETLEKVDVIAAEDTRNSHKLLTHFGISKPMISHHEHNQETSIPKLLSILEERKSIAVISDAGYPLVSDPGGRLVKCVIEHGYPVVSMSGANAAMNALVASGLSCVHYLFYGFLDHKHTKRVRQLEELKEFPYTIVFYEAPHRIGAMLEDVYAVFGDRNICLAREITKLHEEYIRGTVREVMDVADGLKGEMVVVVEGNTKEDTFSMEDAVARVLEYSETLRFKEAVKRVAQEMGCSKNELYQEALKKRG